MEVVAKPFSRNQLLSALPSAELAQIRPYLTRVKWISGQGLYAAGEPIQQVFFVEEGFASVVAEAEDFSGGTEVGLVGREGMTGFAALLSPEALSFNRTMVQMRGAALRMPARRLYDSLGTLPVLRRLLFRALEEAMAQVAQTAACNARHSLTQRLARWLLMAHDRADGDELALTQAFMSVMLAVRRSGVTVAIQMLQAEGVAGQRRGHVIVRDRAGLEAAACGCYGRVQAFVAALAAGDREDPDRAS